MRKLAWIATAGALLALIVLVGVRLLDGQGALAQGTVNFDVDPEVTGNTASTLGTVQDCYEVTCPSAECDWDGSSSFDNVSDYIVDVVVTGDTQAPTVYDASLNYDQTKVHIAAPDTDPLIKMPGATDLSQSLPDSDGTYAAAAVYFVGGPGTAGSGTLVRIGLDIGASGLITFSLNDPPNTAYASGAGDHPVALDSGILAINTSCPTEADVKIVSQFLLADDCASAAPTEIAVSTDTDICLHKTLHNNGPYGPVDVSISTDGTPPADCTAEPDVGNPTSTNLPVSVDVIVDEIWTIHCAEPSQHTFSFDNSIEITTGGVADPDESDNSLQSYFTVDATADADVKIVDQYFIDPPTEILAGTDVDVILSKTLHNNGPYDLVDASISTDATPPADCTATPNPANPTYTNLLVSVDEVIEEVWTIHCDNPGDGQTFTFDNSIAVSTPHIVDPNPTNNAASTDLIVDVLAGPWSAVAALNTNAATDSGDDNEPQVATDGAGNWLAVWWSDENLGGSIGGDNDILMARSTDDAATWTTPAPLNTNAAADSGDDHVPWVATDGGGNWLAVWYSDDDLDGTIGTDYDILVSRSTDEGATWTAPVALNTSAPTDSGWDWGGTVVTDGGGNWLAVWCSDDSLDGAIGTDYDILVARSTDNGATWTDPAALNTNAVSDSGNDLIPQVTTDGAGNWVAVWGSYDDLDGAIGTDADILVALSTDNGATWTAPAPLNTNAATDEGGDEYPRVMTDGLGNWVAVWRSDDSLDGTIGTDTDILVSRSTDNGGTWSVPALLNTNAATDSGSDHYPQVTTDGGGNWVAFWHSEDSLGGTIGTDYDILWARSTDNGASWTAPAPLNTNAATDSGQDISPGVSTDGAGNWAVVWQSADALGGTIGTDNDILYSTAVIARLDLRIGLLLPFTGDLSYFGQPLQNAADLAALYINAAGGVLGAPVTFVVADSETDPTAGVNAAQSLVDDHGVSAIVGAAASGVTYPVAEQVTIPEQVLLVSPASTAPAITGLADDDLVFRTAFSDELQAAVLAQVAWDRGFSTACTMYMNNAYGLGLSNAFTEAFVALGGTVQVQVPHEDGQPSYQTEVETCASGSPQVMVALSYPSAGQVFLQDALDYTSIDQFVFSDGLKSQEMFDALGTANFEGMYGTARAATVTTQFASDYEAEYGEPPPLPYIAETYDAVVAIALAAERAGSNDSLAIRDALRGATCPPGATVTAGAAGIAEGLALAAAGEHVDYEGASGPAEFTEYGDGAGGVVEVWKIDETGQIVTDHEEAVGAPSDADGDGFDVCIEDYLGTDFLDNCPDELGVDDAWPLDINIDALINVAGDVLNLYVNMGKSVGEYPEVQRLDLNGDGAIGAVGDVWRFYYGMLGSECDGGSPSPPSAPSDGPPIAIGIDPETTGNSASTLGDLEVCTRIDVDPGDFGDGAPDHTIDVYVMGASGGPTAYDAQLNYDETKVHIVDPTDPLIKMPDAGDFSETPPDSDGTYIAGAAYLTGGPGTPSDGTLVRVALDVVASGVVTLSLNAPPLAAYASDAGVHSVTLWTGRLAINESCPGDDDDDGVVNAEDNCPAVYNPDQQDVDTDGTGDLCDADTQDSSAVSDPVSGDVTVSDAGGTVSFDGQTAQGGSTVTIVDDPAAVGTIEWTAVGKSLVGAKFSLLSTSALTGSVAIVASFSPGITQEQLEHFRVTKEGFGPLCGQPGSPCTVTATVPPSPPPPPYTQATIEFSLAGDAGLAGSVPQDSDGDGVYDHYDFNPEDGDFGDPDEHDNCPYIHNEGQENMDGDAWGDVCDDDEDGDGFSNTAEAALGSDPLDGDNSPENNGVGSTCSDGIDNDGDTKTDGDDEGCPAVNMAVTISVDQRQVEAGAQDVPLQSIMDGGYLEDAPLQSIPLQSIPLQSIDVQAGPLQSIPLQSIDRPGCTFDGWGEILAGTTLEGVPLQSITLEGLILESEDGDWDDATLQTRLACLTVGDLALTSAPLQSITLVDILLGTTPLQSIPLQSIPLDPVDWCDVLAGTAVEDDYCTLDSGVCQFCTVSTHTVGDLVANGIPLGSIPIQSIPMWDTLPYSTIVDTPLQSIYLAEIPLQSITGKTWPEILEDTALVGANLAETTLGQVMQECEECTPGSPPDPCQELRDEMALIQLGHILWAILSADIADIPWESVPLQSIPLQSIAEQGGSVTYTIQLVNTGSADATDVSVADDLPPGFLYEGGSTTIDGSPAADPDQTVVPGQPTILTWDGLLVPADGGTLTLSFDAFASTSLGTYTSSVSVSNEALPAASTDHAAPITVADNLEPNDPFDLATADSLPELEPGRLYLSYISTATDLDFFRIPVPDESYSITVYLSHLASDNDLVMYSPVDAPLQSIDMQSIPIQGVRIDDLPLQQTPLQEATLQDTVLDDVAIQDVPIQGVPIQSISIDRGTGDETVADTALYESGNYYVQVSGYNGVYSSEPYIIRVKVQPPPGAVTCPARSLPPPPAPPGTPTVPGNVNTLIITNEQRLHQYYGDSAANSLMAKLDDLASAPGIVGAVVPVDYDADVRTAFADWDDYPCSVSKALAVAGSIRTLVHGIIETHPTVQFLVIVGSDEIIPFARVPDEVYISNERLYSHDLSWVEESAVYAALAQGFILTDDFYADLKPISWFERELYVPDLALGRLVEEPSEIEALIDLFLADDTLNPSDAFVTGYDFLIDGANAIAAELGDAGLAVSSLIGDAWTRLDLCNILHLDCGTGTETPAIDSLNAHYDHYRLLPADYDGDLDPSDLVTTADIPPEGTGDTRFNGSILFSVGCHSGLNVCDCLLGSPDPRLRDFAQAWAERGAYYVGNTGYGYGDTEAVALSERLMKYFARELFAASPSSYVGEALMRAKQHYYLTMGHYPLYDEKAMIEATLYGLPMYKVAGGTTPPPDTPPSVTTDPTVLLPRADLNFAPSLNANIDPLKGTYYDVDGEVQMTPYRAIQPRTSQNISISSVGGYENYVAHGALLSDSNDDAVAADYDQLADFNPVIARPTWDLEASEPEPQFVSEGWFPSTLHTINHLETADEVLETLVVVPGQFRRETFVGGQEEGSERIYESLDFQVYYSQDSTDFTRPTFKLAEAVLDIGDSEIDFTVEVTDLDDSGDPGDVKRVVVIYTVTAESPALCPSTGWCWRSLELEPGWGPNEWEGSIAMLPGSIDYLVQAVDDAGNVGFTTNKGVYYEVLQVGAGSDQSVLEGDLVNFTGSTDATLNAPGTFVLWDFGDGSTAIDTLTPAHTYADDGYYTVTLLVKDASGRSGSDTLTVDVSNVDPVVGVAPSLLVTEAGQPVTLHGWFTDPGSDDTHTILWDFDDGHTASGILAPSHAFPAEGSYLVQLQVTDDDGGSSSTTASVVAWRDEICDGVDNDLDGETDEGWDANMNGIPDCVDPELNTDDDVLANDLDEDDDGDGFRDDHELYMGTDPLDACPNSPTHDAWPLDLDKNTLINLGGDVARYIGKIGCIVATNPSCQRLDLDANGLINLGGDVAKFIGKIGIYCT